MEKLFAAMCYLGERNTEDPCVLGPNEYFATSEEVALYAAQMTVELVSVLKHAEKFIRNGIEMGYIHIDSDNSPESELLPEIDHVLSSVRGDK